MANYCILRLKKLKTMGNISGSAAHTFREIPTDNADPKRTHLNVHNGAQNRGEVVEKVRGKLQEAPKIRKNAVLAIEYFIGASPEFFKTATPEQQRSFFEKSIAWLEEKHGKENVIYTGIQKDETTDHMVAYIVPFDKRGKLNASAFLDGKHALSAMQTDFAQKVGKPLGLERGLEGSDASHVSIKDFYAAINSPLPEVKTKVPEVPEPTMSELAKEKMGIETEHSKAVAIAAAARVQREKEKAERQRIIEAKAKAYDAERLKRDAKADKLDELRAKANEVRKVPLGTVLERLGCTPDPADKKNWKTPAGRITVTGEKFFNHDLQQGGGGAIDLVKHIEGLDYKQAVAWLGGNAHREAIIGEVVERARQEAIAALESPKPVLGPPAPEPDKWQRVKEYLVDTRKISAELVDKLHTKGRIYADRFSNAVFLSQDGKSCELRGTGEKPYHGHRGKGKMWNIDGPAPADKKLHKVVFVESAIDALSYADKHGLQEGVRILSTGGSAGDKLRSLVQKVKDIGARLIAAFDNDSEGRRMNEIVKSVDQSAEVKVPIKKDWNADLVHEKTPKIDSGAKKKKGLDIGG